MVHPDDKVQMPWDELDSLENIDTDTWLLDDDSDDYIEDIPYTDFPKTYEEFIWNARLSFNRDQDLLKVIEKVCFDNWLDRDSSWALKECFLQKSNA